MGTAWTQALALALCQLKVQCRSINSVGPVNHSINQSISQLRGSARNGGGEHKGWEGTGTTGEKEEEEEGPEGASDRVVAWAGQGQGQTMAG